MRDKRKAKNCLISRQQAGYKYRFHVPLILNGIGGILFAPLAQMDKSTRLLIEESWVRAPYGAYAEVAELEYAYGSDPYGVCTLWVQIPPSALPPTVRQKK